MKIRFATIQDVVAIGQINYTSWQETYRGIIEDSFLDEMSVEQTKRKWLSFFKNPTNANFLLVLENDEGEVVGYCCAGKAREKFYDFDAEVFAIYLLKRYQGKGWGKALFTTAMNELVAKGYKACCLFVLKDNPTIGFYRTLKPDFEDLDVVKLGDKDYDDVGLGWRELDLHKFGS